MTLSRDIPQDTRTRQHKASNPALSVWVSANAGSGKTHVLVQRVLRLLLSGVPPAKILCLTFTKAAAANMALKVFEALAAWTRLDDHDLRAAILETGTAKAEGATLVFARRLFARTVETPGGLKIQTIHAFCERLLHVFPFEANVPAQFEVLEDLHQAALLEQARTDVLAQAAQDESTLGFHLEQVIAQTSDAGFEEVIREAMSHAHSFRKMSLAEYETQLRHSLRLLPDDSTASITHTMIEDGIAPTRWNDIASFLDQQAKTDRERAENFRQASAAWHAQQIEACLDFYLRIFFTEGGSGTPFKSMLTSAPAKARPDIQLELQNEQGRLATLRDKYKTAAMLERTISLFAIAREVFSRYGHFKAARGFLDFNDLIEKTLSLLSRSDARWVLYKLDRGIDHILVDEAQDTSEAQWKILEELMSDFAVGAGASDRQRPRTFFAVGDDKQSIFSFQGAAPHMFHQMREQLARKFGSGGEEFTHVQLNLSFRSVPAVLTTVDRIFALPAHHKGLVDARDGWIGHDALKRDLPGLIEFWPLTGETQREAAVDWKLPLDVLDEQDPPSITAKRIATKIAAILTPDARDYVHDSKTRVPRAVRPGDILILVRTRGPFFEAIIRALKQAAVPVAGADRLDLTAHIAVMDLIAAGRAALLPQDDLTLACVLKSPLIGLDDDDLLMIAPHRPASLFDALAQSPEPRYQRAFAKLSAWRERAIHDLPFAFYMRLLSEDHGRHDIEARLGPEARDAIDEFLRLALLHEREPAPSLGLFLSNLETVNLAIKRDMETGTEAVRVMTVHAAKGLEAKIVFLPDTCGAPGGQHDSKLFALDGSFGSAPVLAWSPRKSDDCPEVAAARDKSREASDEEYRRLLYVALTRAEEQLYIAGFYGVRAPPPGCWYEMMRATLEGTFDEVPAFWNPEETLLRRSSSEAPRTAVMSSDPAPPMAATAIPDWLSRPALPESGPRPPLRPSSALAAADAMEVPVSPIQREAMRRGQFLHVLLQYLPAVAQDRRLAMGEAFLAARAAELTAAERTDYVATVLSVIDAPELDQLFTAGSRAEVPISGRVMRPDGTPIEVLGQVDRIAESATEVLIADFKTGQPCSPDKTPEAYLIQMALYRAALAPLWPRKRLRMLLIWTYGPNIAELSDTVLNQALAAL